MKCYWTFLVRNMTQSQTDKMAYSAINDQESKGNKLQYLFLEHFESRRVSEKLRRNISFAWKNIEVRIY